MFFGKQKLEFCRRLDNWQDLATYFDIPADHQRGFAPGREAHGIWDWLEARNQLRELPAALTYLRREDIVNNVLQPPPPHTSVPAVTWQDSPFPGLRHFTATNAPIFFGRTQEAAALLERLRQERFVAVVGASGSGKSSLVAAGVLPQLHDIPGGQDWQCIRFTPGGLGDNPFVALAARLEPALERHGLTGRAIVDRLHASRDLTTLRPICASQVIRQRLHCCCSWISSRNCLPSPEPSTSGISSPCWPMPCHHPGCAWC